MTSNTDNDFFSPNKVYADPKDNFTRSRSYSFSKKIKLKSKEKLNNVENSIRKETENWHSTTIHLQVPIDQISVDNAKDEIYENGSSNLNYRKHIGNKQKRKFSRNQKTSKHSRRFTKLRKNIKFTKREMLLLRESWAIMIIDGLSEDSLRKFHQDVNDDRNIIMMDNYTNVVTNNVYMNVSPNDEYNDIELPELYLTINEKKIMDSVFCTQVYENLIALDSQLDISFPTLRHQTVGTSNVINRIIHNLEDTSVLDADLKSLGKRHSRIIGITAEQFSALGIALLKTFKARFGILFSNELSSIWLRLYLYLANSLLLFGEDPQLVEDSISKNVNRDLTEKASDSRESIALSLQSTLRPDAIDAEAYDTDLTEFSIPFVGNMERQASIPSESSFYLFPSRRSSNVSGAGKESKYSRDEGHVHATASKEDSVQSTDPPRHDTMYRERMADINMKMPTLNTPSTWATNHQLKHKESSNVPTISAHCRKKFEQRGKNCIIM